MPLKSTDDVIDGVSLQPAQRDALNNCHLAYCTAQRQGSRPQHDTDKRRLPGPDYAPSRRRSARMIAASTRRSRRSGPVLLGFPVDLDTAPYVHHRQSLGGLAKIGKTDTQRREINRLGQALEFHA